MPKTQLLVLSALLLTVLSCKKDGDNNYRRLKQSNFQYTSSYDVVEGYQQFHFDNQGRIATINGHHISHVLFNNTKTEQSRSIALEYSANGQLVKSTHTINNIPTYFFSYYYNSLGQVIKKIHTKLHPSAQVEDHSYTYDAQGRLIADSIYASPNYVYRYSTYRYDGAGNIVVFGGAQRNVWGGGFVPYGEGYGKYDNKRNPYSLLDHHYHALMESSELFNQNNTIEGGAMNGSSKTTYENTYLSNGLLKKAVRPISSDVTMVVSYEYE